MGCSAGACRCCGDVCRGSRITGQHGGALMLCVKTVDAQHPPCGRYAHRPKGVFRAPRGPESAGPGVPDTRNPTAPAAGRPARMDFAQTRPVKAGGRDILLPNRGTEDGGLKMCQPHGLLTGKEDSPYSGPPARSGRGHRPGHAVPVPHTGRGPKPPASARPAHGGRFTPAGPGAGLCCTCANGPHGAVVASRAGKRGAFPDPPGRAAPFLGSGRYSRPVGG